jgi:hypothetical protein
MSKLKCSVLGPLLFILYINDLPKVLKHCKINLFADDALIWIACDSVEEAESKLNEDLEQIWKWLCNNEMALNVNKTKSMCITLKKNITLENCKILINSTEIEIVDCIKYLGVYIDNKLKFHKHCDYICKKMLNKYHLIKRLSPKLTFWSKILFHRSLIGSHLDFCSSVLFLLNIGQTNKLQKVQNRCMRLILKVKWDII